MKQISFILLAFAALFTNYIQAQNTPLLTPWGEKLDTENPWPEYPRPIMERARWMNLNGKWDYAILPKGSSRPTSYV